jgi:8-oxo-dGTP pyrophosphatase MutT (NUDIX family)
MNKIKKAGAIILNNNMDKCLMVFQKSSNLWGIPKGQKEDNEDNYVCMIREIKEEVGLNLNNIKFEILKSAIIMNESFIYIIRLLLDTLPICSPPLENNQDNYEIGQIEWIILKDAYIKKNNCITKKAFIVLKDYFKNNINSNFILNNNQKMFNVITY